MNASYKRNIMLRSIFTFIFFFPLIVVSQSAQHGGNTRLEASIYPTQDETNKLEPQTLDFRYSPLIWQSCIGLPDDIYKTIVGSNGNLYYDYRAGSYTGYGFDGFHTRVMASLAGEPSDATVTHQKLFDARTPVVITEKKIGNILLHQEAWAGAPQSENIEDWAPRRVDYLWLTLKNNGLRTESSQIILQVDTHDALLWNKIENKLVKESDPKGIFLSIDPANVSVKNQKGSIQLLFPKVQLAPGEEFQTLITLYPGRFAHPINHDKRINEKYEALSIKAHNIINKAPTSLTNAQEERTRAISFWAKVPLPYDKITVPDPALQRLLYSSIRNIYQSREVWNGRPLFQVGPNNYRGTWAADGPFIMEAITYLGQWKEVRASLEQQIAVGPSGGPSGVEFSKEMGLRLWMIWRHAQLTNDWKWLEKMWPKVEQDVNTIMKYRKMSLNDSSDVNDGLMPKGKIDGGIRGIHYGYTSVYWNLAGLRAALFMADKMKKSVLPVWQAEYKDFWRTFDAARNRDKLKDARGNLYVPSVMKGGVEHLPQAAAWAFLQAVHPGEIFSKEDSLMLGTMAMLDGTTQEGLILGTGFLTQGVWNYAASFYAHAHLWLGHGRKAASTLYAFANHASPVLTWREEQHLVGQMKGERYIGDMPHNWASAEFIRLIRDLMILERGDQLHLLQGMPRAWTKSGNKTGLNDIPTSFGNMSLSVSMADDEQSAIIKIDPPKNEAPKKIILHLEHFGRPVWAIKSGNIHLTPEKSFIEISTDKPIELKVEFLHTVEQRYRSPRPGFDLLQIQEK